MIECPYCLSTDMRNAQGNRKGKTQFQCRDCKKYSTHETPVKFEDIYNQPKILVFDLENAPMVCYVWNTKVWNAYIGQDQIKDDWHMISWSAKWLNDSQIINDCITPKEAKNRDDKRIVKSLWKMFDEADIVIAHNAVKFDVAMANTAFIRNNIKPPSPYQIIDTLKVAKKNLRFTHNSLNYLGEFLGVGEKIHTDFNLWIECMEGNKKALKQMQDYNDQDVFLLEDVYYKLLPFIKSHPNLNNLQDTKKCCSSCGSKKIRPRGNYRTAVNTYQSYVCSDCGSYSRSGGKRVQPLAR